MNAPATPRRSIALLAWVVPLLLLVAEVPAFVSLGLDSDPLQWDLFTRSVVRGGIPYREVCENNLPGMYWLQGTARALVGWSMGALRAVDLVIMAAVVGLLVAWLPGLSLAGRALSAALLLACYLSTSEWCHCQRDPWMMLPALVAMYLRAAQARRLETGGSHAGVLFGLGLVEGFVWGLAVWVKPYAAVPAAAAWLWSVAPAILRGWSGWRRALADAQGLFVGGLAAGGAGAAWLSATGAWPWFNEVLDWNRDYLAVDVYQGTPRGLVYLGFAVRTFPWSLAYLAAVPYAFALLLRVRPEPAARLRALLAAFYLGWLAQVLFLQHCYDYVHLPTILLSLALLADLAARGRPWERRAVTALLLFFVVVGAGPRAAQRVELWGRCVAEGGTPELRDRLGILHRTSWVELERVAVFLEGQGVRDREVTCFDMPSLPLYARLNLEAPTRYTLLRNCLTCFFRHRRPILAAVADSHTRLLVCDFTTLPDHPDDLPHDAGAPGLPPLPERWEKPYPWARHIVFRSGRFLVLRLDGPETRRWLTEVLGFTSP